MIELRWAVYGAQNKILQYRVSIRDDLPPIAKFEYLKWSEWKDVPSVYMNEEGGEDE